ARRTGLRAEPRRPPAGGRPGRRRLSRLHLGPHPPSRASRHRGRLLRQLRLLHLRGGGDRRAVRPAAGLRAEPADLLDRTGRGKGGTDLGPGRAARRDQDGALRCARPQPALGHPPMRRLLAGRSRLAPAGQESHPQETRPALSPAAAVSPRPRPTSPGPRPTSPGPRPTPAPGPVLARRPNLMVAAVVPAGRRGGWVAGAVAHNPRKT